MDINYKISIKVFGAILCILGIAMLLPLTVGIIHNDTQSVKAFALVLIPSIIVGSILMHSFQSSKASLKIRDGAFIVSISWFLCGLIGALPFVLSGSIPNFTDAFFETSSGFTTTGATILSDIEALPKSMLFWRSFTHWLGGMGILVFTIALLPAIGIGGQHIVAAEAPGPTLSKIVPKISDTARYLYTLYLVFTLLETILLMFGGMSLFDALCHSFSTVATGGFSNYNASIAHFDSVYIEMVITLFMFLSGINFNLFFIFFRHGLKSFYKDSEWKLYVIIIAITTLLMTSALFLNNSYSLGNSIRYSLFQDLAIITSTGFSTADYMLWPTFAQMLLFMLFFCGASSSSTGGGIKVIRILVLLKMVKRAIVIRLHPNAVIPVKVNNQQLSRDTVSNICNFLFIYLGLGMFGAFVISLLNGFDFISSISAAFSAIGNIGPGFNALGPTENMSIMSGFSKWLLSFMMIAGRLEIFTLLMLFTRKFWNPFR